RTRAPPDPRGPPGTQGADLAAGDLRFAFRDRRLRPRRRRAHARASRLDAPDRGPGGRRSSRLGARRRLEGLRRKPPVDGGPESLRSEGAAGRYLTSTVVVCPSTTVKG